MIVLDTHALIWLLGDPDRLTEVARTAIRRCRYAGEPLAISCQSLYEITRGISRGRIRVHLPLVTFLEKIEAEFTVVPLTAQIARTAASFSSDFPGDPFDRIIAASALAHGARLVTADRNILRSGEIETIW